MRQFVSFAFLVLIAALFPIPWSAQPAPRRGRVRTPEKLETVRRFPSNMESRVLLSGTPTSKAPVAPTSIGTTASPFRSPTYQYPSYPPAYFKPSNSPLILPSESSYQQQNDTGVSRKTKIIIGVVCSMIFVFLVAVCCLSNQVNEFRAVDPVELRRQIDEDMQPGKLFVWKRPAGSFLGITWTQKYFALFFTTRIKMRWSWHTAVVQFLFGWISFFTTVIAMIIPTNLLNSVIGMSALFLSALIVHVWYGFLRHWNITWLCLGMEENRSWADLLEDVKKVSSSIYHNDDRDHFDKWIHWIAAPFVAVLHLAAIVWCIAVYSFAIIWNVSNSHTDRIPMDAIRFYAGFGGALSGSLVYPILFLVSDTRGLKLTFAIMHLISLQYYEARLFGMTLAQFGQSIAFKVLADFAILTPGYLGAVKAPNQDRRNSPEPGTKEEETKEEETKEEETKEEETDEEEEDEANDKETANKEKPTHTSNENGCNP